MFLCICCFRVYEDTWTTLCPHCGENNSIIFNNAPSIYFICIHCAYVYMGFEQPNQCANCGMTNLNNNEENNPPTGSLGVNNNANKLEPQSGDANEATIKARGRNSCKSNSVVRASMLAKFLLPEKKEKDKSEKNSILGKRLHVSGEDCCNESKVKRRRLD